MTLTDVVARTARPREKAYKLADAHGLYLLVVLTALSADLAGEGQREA